MHPSSKRVPFILVLSVTVLCATWIFAQEGARRSPFSDPPKNLKVLKVEKGEDLRPIMRNFNQSLGVECGFCHDTQDFSKDVRPHKEMARKMIQMVDKLNKEILVWEGAPRATCFMCHNGSPYPHFNPPQAAGPAPAAPPAGGAPGGQPGGAQPGGGERRQ